MNDDVYTLDDSEYEILESESRGQITSEDVMRKLNSNDHFIGPIEQSDFDDKDYTLTGYFMIDGEDYPRNIKDNKATLAGSVAAEGVYFGVTEGMDIDASTAGQAIAGFAIASYGLGLYMQDQDFSTAFANSFDKLLE